VAGVHGVGKSTVCNVISKEFSIPHYTASQIIRAEKASAISANSKQVADVVENQRLLIQGISRLLVSDGLLLDGHFTMQRKSDSGIEVIQLEVFRALQVSAVVVFIDDSTEIAKRMLARDKTVLPVEFLQEHQAAEVAHAKYIASELNVPIVVLHAFDTEGMARNMISWGFVRAE